MNTATQREDVLQYMRDFGSITPLQALDLGVMRLASRISDLKRSGYNIKVEMIKGTNRYNKPTRFAKYSLMEGNNA